MATNVYDLTTATPQLDVPSPRFGAGSGTLGRHLAYGIDASSTGVQTRLAPRLVIELEFPAGSSFPSEGLQWGNLEQGLRRLAAEIIFRHLAQAPLVQFSSRQRDVDETCATFSLNTTQAAAVFKTSRQTIIGWRAGQNVRRHEYLDRIAALRDFAAEWQRQSRVPVGDGLLHRDNTTGMSLIQLLQQDILDVDKLRAHLAKLAAHMNEHWGASDRLIEQHQGEGWSKLPPGWRSETSRQIASGNSFRRDR